MCSLESNISYSPPPYFMSLLYSLARSVIILGSLLLCLLRSVDGSAKSSLSLLSLGSIKPFSSSTLCDSVSSYYTGVSLLLFLNESPLACSL